MKILLKNNFSVLQVNEYCIHSLGINPALLSNNLNNIDCLINFLTHVSHQFAVVITKNDSLYFACVDHLASIPLYYNQNCITDSWHVIDIQNDIFETDWQTLVEIFLLGGQNINTNTQYKNVSRILPGRYLTNTEQKVYKTLMSFPRLECNLKETIINKFCAAESDNNVLMFSGGTDSVFLLHLALKYGKKNWRIIHMFSDQEINNEFQIAKRVESYYGCTIEAYNLDNYENLPINTKNKITEQGSRTTFEKYWHHEEMFPKLILLNMANVSSNEKIWTGEIGDQLFGGPKLSSLLATLVQQRNIESIVNLWIDLSCSYNASYITDLSKHDFYQNKFQDVVKGPVWKTAYKKLSNEITDIFKQSDVNDLMLKFIHMNYIIKGPFRVWPYSQLPEYSFYHIFADYDIARIVFNSTADKITPNGILKGCLLNFFKEELPDYVWKLPKAGPTMPTERLRKRFIG